MLLKSRKTWKENIGVFSSSGSSVCNFRPTWTIDRHRPAYMLYIIQFEVYKYLNKIKSAFSLLFFYCSNKLQWLNLFFEKLNEHYGILGHAICWSETRCQMGSNKFLHEHPWSPNNAFPLQCHLYVDVCGFGWNISTTFGWTDVKLLFRHSCFPLGWDLSFLQDRRRLEKSLTAK